MAHRKAKLTPFGRLLLVRRVEVEGWPAVRVAESLGVSRATAYKWVRRYREFGAIGLEDRSSRPRRCPKALSQDQVERILQARRELRHGPHRLAFALGMPRSTIYQVLHRHGASRLHDDDRLTGVPIRYVREHPGELIHIDTKKLGRIPPGGGHRMVPKQESFNRNRRSNSLRPGYDYIHVAVDDASRLAFVQVHSDQRDRTVAQFLLDAAGFFADHGIRLQRIMTDNGGCYRSHLFADAMRAIGAKHKLTRPYRPQTNGKAERFIRTLAEEWAYARFYPSNEDRLETLPSWVAFYNALRPHTGLQGKAPLASLVNNVHGNFNYLRVGAGAYEVTLALDSLDGALLCDALDCKRLSPEHGAPWRLLVSGDRCFTSVKWVDRLEVTSGPGEPLGERVARSRLRPSPFLPGHGRVAS